MPRSDRSLAAALFESLRDGDRTRLGALLSRLQGRLEVLAKQRLTEALAEDAVQETLETLWTKRDALRNADHVLPFTFQILRNKIGNAYLRSERNPEVGTNFEAGTREFQDHSTNPHSMVEGREFEKILDRAIERCSEEHEMWGRVLRMLREGRSPAEIREALGEIPMATVHTRIFRARQRLKEILRDEYGIDL
jgi:RNA polymerase sigma factor (sigma-70 family)